MNNAENLSIRFKREHIENAINNNGLHAINSYGLEQLKEAYQYYLDDNEVLSKLLNGRNSNKFKQLYTNGQLVFDFFNKYHNAKYAVGSLVMFLLRATDFNMQQTNRILHRSPMFKFWNDPRNSIPGTNLEVINWDKIYMTTSTNPMNAKTHGELTMEKLTRKMQQPMEV